jgi:hypothetical protein
VLNLYLFSVNNYWNGAFLDTNILAMQFETLYLSSNVVVQLF